MSSYFDAIDNEIYERINLYATEEKLVRDVTICAMFPGFPEDLRKHVHAAILRNGINSLPTFAYEADPATDDDVARCLGRLNSDLHDIFHEAARRGLSDSPSYPLRLLASAGEEERENLVGLMPAYACKCGKVWGSAANRALACLRCGELVEPEEKTLLEFRTERGDFLPAYECECGKHWAGHNWCVCGKPGVYLGQRYFVTGDGFDYPIRVQE